MTDIAPEEFTSLHDAFAYFVECQLATVEGLKIKKSTPQYELRRHESIARSMVECVRAWKIAPRRSNTRLTAALEGCNGD